MHSPDGHLARADERPVLQLENSGAGRSLRRRLLIVAGASYLVIIIAYAGAGVASRDVAQYAAAATAAEAAEIAAAAADAKDGAEVPAEEEKVQE